MVAWLVAQIRRLESFANSLWKRQDDVDLRLKACEEALNRLRGNL